jgi:F-type H+-transporting ATPase subunit epsilon
MPASTLQVEVISPEKIVYKGEAIAITSYNQAGQFDILAEHSHFITLIRDKVIIRKVGKTILQFQLQYGILRCHDNQIKIYIGL